MPGDARVEEPYRLTPQLALRIAILGTVVLGAFAILFLRLWSLQVLAGPKYLHAAQNNQLRTVRVQAPRGAIVDRDGDVLVGTTAGYSVQLWPADLPTEGRYQLLRRLSARLGVPVGWMAKQIAKRKNDPLTPVVVKRGIHQDQVRYLYERQAEFPGVRVAQSYLREYPNQALAAHVLGHVGEASKRQLERNPRLAPGDEVGQGGIEAVYDEVLRGRAGGARLRVDSLGRPRSDIVLSDQPHAGYALRLTIDTDLQRAAEQALRFGIAAAHRNKQWYANGGTIVALDPRNGQVLAMASNPTYKPSVYVGRKDAKKLLPLLSEKHARAENFPAVNRAIQGVYAPGSTFKPVTALAAMEQHLIGPYDPLPCTPTYIRYKQPFNNWDPYRNEPMTLATALARSCDTYFYELGYRFYKLPPEYGHPLQDWAARMGFGQRTGIDVGTEESGLLPTPEWRRARYRGKDFSELDRIWKPGYSIQMAIGQGELQVTPMQMTRFYALLANGGKLVTPHLVLQAEQPGDNGAPAIVRQTFTPPAPKPTGIDPAALRVVQQGMLLATHYPLGTAAGVFDSFPVAIAGKTGTAEKWSHEHRRLLDQAWWCGYGPFDNPEIAVCAVIENGGHGGDAAAPAALKVFEEYFGRRGGPIAQTESD